MTGKERTGFLLAILAAFLWSPHFYAVQRFVKPDTNLMVFYFHVVFWAALGSLVFLTLVGRLDEISVFKRNESRFFLLALTGGYGFWLFRAIALKEVSAAGAAHMHILFYAAPLILALFTIPDPRGAGAKELGSLALGFVGCIMILAPSGTESQESLLAAGPGTSLIAVAAALCWGIFTFVSRGLLRREKPLPVTAVVWSMGAICLLVTCLSTGNNPLDITRNELWISMILGIVTAALCFITWLKALSIAGPCFIAPVWYIGLVFGILWSRWFAGTSPGWWTIGGALLILLVSRSGSSQTRGSPASLSDLLRS